MREQQANRLKDEFLATVSHELRTPLNAVLGWARVLRSADVDPALQARALESIERNAQSQARLIEDILEVSRIVTGKLRLKVRTLDLAQVIDAALDVVRPAAEAKDITLRTDIPERPWRERWRRRPAAADRLEPALERGQVHAARRHRHRGAGARRTGPTRSSSPTRARASIPRSCPHVFAPFRQADASTTRDHGGLGLGLAIVRQLTELHGGTVRAESHGRRSRLAVHRRRCPRSRRRPAPPRTQGGTAPRRPTGPPDLAGVRVMVVDDDRDARELLTATLGYYGADVTAAESAAEALVLLPEVRPDVLLSDIGMSGEDGYSFIRRVRALPRRPRRPHTGCRHHRLRHGRRSRAGDELGFPAARAEAVRSRSTSRARCSA